MKIDYAKLFTLKKDGRYQGYWHEMVDGKPTGTRHALCDRDPKRLFDRIAEKETPTALTFKAVAQEWWDEHVDKLERSSQSTYRGPFDKAIEEHGNMAIQSITPSDINAVMLRLKSEGKSYKYAATVRSIYKQIFDHAIVTRKLKENPVAAVPVPRGMRKGHRDAPETDIIARVKENLDKPFGDFVALLLYTGMRTQEAVALTWDDIDDKFIHINAAMDLHGNPRMKSTKTTAGERIIPIVTPLRKYLVKPNRLPPSHLVFHKKGKALTRAQISTLWLRWCKEAGLAVQHTYPNRHRGERECTRTEWRPVITPHQLRHNFATVLFEAGFDELATKNIMGHEDIETTRRIYTTLRKDYMDEQYQRMDKIFDGKRDGKMP